MMDKLLSIITINLNNSIGLERTIKSVLEQDYHDFEFIIIDGGGSEESLSLIKNYEKHFTYWVSETDKGIYDAMNKGIEKANGEYCYFLNSGDWLIASSTLSEIFSPPPKEDIILFDIISHENNRQERRTGIGKNDLMFSDMFGAWCHQSVLIKRSLFSEYGLYDNKYKIAADWVFLLKSLGLGKATFEYRPQLLSNFDNTGISSQSDEWYYERQNALNEMVPKRIMMEYRSIDYRRYKRIKSSQLLYSAFVFLNRIAILWQKIFKL